MHPYFKNDEEGPRSPACGTPRSNAEEELRQQRRSEIISTVMLCVLVFLAFAGLALLMAGCGTAGKGGGGHRSAMTLPSGPPMPALVMIRRSFVTPTNGQVVCYSNGAVVKCFTWSNAPAPRPAGVFSIAEYIPANGGHDTNRRWTRLEVSHRAGHWGTVTSNEQLSGYWTTNNIRDTNAAAQFRTVSEL